MRFRTLSQLIIFYQTKQFFVSGSGTTINVVNTHSGIADEMKKLENIENKIDSVETFEDWRELQNEIESKKWQDRSYADRIKAKISAIHPRIVVMETLRNVRSGLPHMSTDDVGDAIHSVEKIDTLGDEELKKYKAETISVLVGRLDTDFMQQYNDFVTQFKKLDSIEAYEMALNELNAFSQKGYWNDPRWNSRIYADLFPRLEKVRHDVEVINHIESKANDAYDENSVGDLMKYIESNPVGDAFRDRLKSVKEHVQGNIDRLRDSRKRAIRFAQGYTF